MAEYIERSVMIDRIRKMANLIGFENPAVAIDCTIRSVEHAPAADVAPVVHGHIVPAEQPKKVLLDGKCVKCNSLMLSTDKFCPSCGARMDGEGGGYYKKQPSCTTPDGAEWFASGAGKGGE